MLEQPVAFAMSARSPNTWLSNLRYGVSPQPEHAPENSKSGRRSCTFLTLLKCNALPVDDGSVGEVSGSLRKNSQFCFSVSRSGGWGCILMALRLVLLLSFTGQASTHNMQPVQSSTLTCRVYFRSGSSFQRASADWNAAGAVANSCGSYTLARITACGQTSTHLPHWMQRFGSQTGTSSAKLRRSHCAVALG